MPGPCLKQKQKHPQLVGFLILYRADSKFPPLRPGFSVFSPRAVFWFLSDQRLCSPRADGFSVLGVSFSGACGMPLLPAGATRRPTLPAPLRCPFFHGACPDLPDPKQFLLLLCLPAPVTSHTPCDILVMREHVLASSSIRRTV